MNERKMAKNKLMEIKDKDLELWHLKDVLAVQEDGKLFIADDGFVYRHKIKVGVVIEKFIHKYYILISEAETKEFEVRNEAYEDGFKAANIVGKTIPISEVEKIMKRWHATLPQFRANTPVTKVMLECQLALRRVLIGTDKQYKTNKEVKND